MGGSGCSTGITYNADIARKLRIILRKGDSFLMNAEIKNSDGDDIDMSVYTFNMHIKETEESVSSVLSSTANQITLTGGSGVLTVEISADNTASIDEGDYVYDIEVINSNNFKTTWLYGDLCVNQDVTPNP